MIVGITCEKDGSVIQRLPVNTKVAIGIGPSGDKNYPEKVDAFLFLKRGPGGTEWVKDEKLMAHYAPKCKHGFGETCPDCCRSVNILFLDDDIEHILPNEYAWWSKTNKKCWGDGLKATRRNNQFPDGAPWSPCGEACPDLQEKRCKPSADLYFLLADFPSLGSVCRLHTSSARSIKNLFGGLNQIAAITDGKLAGVPIPLQVSWEKTSYTGKDGKDHPTEVPILGFKTNIIELIENIDKMAQLFSAVRKALGAGRAVVVEPEVEKAAEISGEFAQKALPEAPAAPSVSDQPSGSTQAAPPTTQEAAKPEPVETEPATYTGLPKSLKQMKVGRGPNKGKIFWKAVLQHETGEVEILIDRPDLGESFEKAIKQAREIQVVCEVRTQASSHAIVAQEIAYTAKVEAPPEEDGGWMFPE